MFSTLLKTEITIFATFNLSSANALNLVHSKKLSFGKELILCVYKYLNFEYIEAVSTPTNVFPGKNLLNKTKNVFGNGWWIHTSTDTIFFKCLTTFFLTFIMDKKW